MSDEQQAISCAMLAIAGNLDALGAAGAANEVRAAHQLLLEAWGELAMAQEQIQLLKGHVAEALRRAGGNYGRPDR